MKYRIITDAYAGYAVQEKPKWWPFWYESGYCNTFNSVEKAEEYISLVTKLRNERKEKEKNSGKVVKYVK